MPSTECRSSFICGVDVHCLSVLSRDKIMPWYSYGFIFIPDNGENNAISLNLVVCMCMSVCEMTWKVMWMDLNEIFGSTAHWNKTMIKLPANGPWRKWPNFDPPRIRDHLSQWRRSVVIYCGPGSVTSSHQTVSDYILRQRFPNIQQFQFLTTCRCVTRDNLLSANFTTFTMD